MWLATYLKFENWILPRKSFLKSHPKESFVINSIQKNQTTCRKSTQQSNTAKKLTLEEIKKYVSFFTLKNYDSVRKKKNKNNNIINTGTARYTVLHGAHGNEFENMRHKTRQLAEHETTYNQHFLPEFQLLTRPLLSLMKLCTDPQKKTLCKKSRQEL